VGQVHLDAAEGFGAERELVARVLVDLVPRNVVERIPPALALGLLEKGRIFLVHPHREPRFHGHVPPSRRSTTFKRSATVTSSTRSSSGIMMLRRSSISPTICIIDSESIPSSVMTDSPVTSRNSRLSTSA